MLIWAEKYRPKRLKEIAGNPSAIKSLTVWMEKWKSGFPEKRAVLLHGPPGTGKTSVAYAIASELGYDYIEMNASDRWNQEIVNRVVGSAATLGTLNPKQEKKVLIIDEVDGIHGKVDHGGLNALKKWIKISLQPIILIANDPWALPPDFRNMCEMFQFRKIDQWTAVKALINICRKEGITTEEKVLKLVVTNSNGDLRSAINDLQALTEGKKTLDIDDMNVLTIRDTELRIFETMAKVFKTTSCDRAIEAVRDSGEEPETVMKWIAENIPIEYEDPEEIAAAFDAVSKADIFMGRILRRQDWGLLKYTTDLMSAGVALAKKSSYRKFSRYQYPQIFSLYARTKKDREMMDSIAEKMQGKKDSLEKCHGSKNLMIKEFFPLIKNAMAQNFTMGSNIASELDFNLDEIQYLAENETLAKKIYERAIEITAERIRKRTLGGKQASLFEFSK